jgi:hypothetical protein
MHLHHNNLHVRAGSYVQVPHDHSRGDTYRIRGGGSLSLEPAGFHSSLPPRDTFEANQLPLELQDIESSI